MDHMFDAVNVPFVLLALLMGGDFFFVLWLFVYRGSGKRLIFPWEPDDKRKEDRRTGAAPQTGACAPCRFPDELERILDERSRVMALHYGMTKREADILPYLLRGRSARYIADDLLVSENTIRSHIRRILEKTDTHSKQDLIDIADSIILQQESVSSG